MHVKVNGEMVDLWRAINDETIVGRWASKTARLVRLTVEIAVDVEGIV